MSARPTSSDYWRELIREEREAERQWEEEQARARAAVKWTEAVMIRKQRRSGTQRTRCIDGWEIRQAYGVPEVRIVDHKGRPVRVMSANCNLSDRELQRILLRVMEEKQ